MAGGAFVTAVLIAATPSLISARSTTTPLRSLMAGPRRRSRRLAAHANIYLVARKDLLPVTVPLPEFLKGKRIAVPAAGNTDQQPLR